MPASCVRTAACSSSPSTTDGPERGAGHAHPEGRERILHRVGDGGGRRDRPALPDTLQAERIPRRRVLEVHGLDRRQLHRGRHQVIHEGSGQELCLLVVDHLLQEPAADALRDAAVDLALHDHRVDEGPAVVGHQVAEELHRAGAGVHVHHRDVGGARVGHGRLVMVDRGLEVGGGHAGLRERGDRGTGSRWRAASPSPAPRARSRSRPPPRCPPERPRAAPPPPRPACPSRGPRPRGWSCPR